MSNEKDIPFIIVESMLDRQSATIKKLWVICILLIVFLVGSNSLWVWYESQFVYETTTIEADQDGEGINIVGMGDVNYGAESESY